MTQKFKPSWKSSKQPRNQRRYRKNAPQHIRAKFMGAHLCKDLRKKYGKRSVRVIKGDKVQIMTGQFKGKSGKVERVDVKNQKVFIAKIEIQKIDGSKIFYPIHPSNLEITELNLGDKKRAELLKRK